MILAIFGKTQLPRLLSFKKFDDGNFISSRLLFIPDDLIFERVGSGSGLFFFRPCLGVSKGDGFVF